MCTFVGNLDSPSSRTSFSSSLSGFLCEITNSHKLEGTGVQDVRYKEVMESSELCLCPGGNNFETFRIYESLELGCVPVVNGEDEGFREWRDMVGNFLDGIRVEEGVVVCSGWEECGGVIERMGREEGALDGRREGGRRIWEMIKGESRRVLEDGLGITREG